MSPGGVGGTETAAEPERVATGEPAAAAAQSSSVSGVGAIPLPSVKGLVISSTGINSPSGIKELR